MPAPGSVGTAVPAIDRDRLRSLTERELRAFAQARPHSRALHERCGLEPDLLTAGKALAGGVPVGVLGLSAATAEAMLAQREADYEDTGWVGGTLAGNPLSTAAMRATLGEELTAEAYAHTIPLAARFDAALSGLLG